MNFRKRNKTAPGLSLQIAPMLDVVFLLLCFFVTTQLFSQWETEVDITLPTAETGEMPQRLPGEVIINIFSDGQTVINGQTLADDQLRDLLQRLVNLFPGQPVLIRADRKTEYAHIIRVLDLCRQMDIWNISFATGAPAD